MFSHDDQCFNVSQMTMTFAIETTKRISIMDPMIFPIFSDHNPKIKLMVKP